MSKLPQEGTLHPAVEIMVREKLRGILHQKRFTKLFVKFTLVKVLLNVSKCLVGLGMFLVLLLLLFGTSILLVLLLIVGLLALIGPPVIYLALGRFNNKDDLKI